MTHVNVQLLLTGNELMSGDIVDSNSAMIAHHFKDINLEITRKVTVADSIRLLINEILNISEQADILIINGGLGPTVDDMTAQALAIATKVPLVQHPLAFEHIKSWCLERNVPINSPNLKQAILPEGCEIIANKRGSAVGFFTRFNHCDIYCTPGVPHELDSMLIEEIIPKIVGERPNKTQLDITRLQVFGIGESNIQKLIDDTIHQWPQDVELGFRAGKPLLEIKITTKSAKACQEKQICIAQLIDLLGDHILGQVITKAPKTLAEQLVTLLIKADKKITLAESCTGGLIASLITQVAGSSNIFEAGYITYSNRIKSELLGVKKETLQQFGAVSEETVMEMAQGALLKSSADVVIAVSGIAGPNGGSKEKPVGTVWIAWGDKEYLQTTCLHIFAPRINFQKYVASVGLDLIRRLLIKSKEKPFYITHNECEPVNNKR